jgi:hypothetical protein
MPWYRYDNCGGGISHTRINFLVQVTNIVPYDEIIKEGMVGSTCGFFSSCGFG